jgi:non-homologous end joining protein Ku
MDEILASQKQMLVRSNKPTDAVSDEKLAEMYARHLAKVEAWLKAQPNVDVLYVDYNQMLVSPQEHAEEVNTFLDERLAVEKMVGVIDPSLYRQRR